MSTVVTICDDIIKKKVEGNNGSNDCYHSHHYYYYHNHYSKEKDYSSPLESHDDKRTLEAARITIMAVILAAVILFEVMPMINTTPLPIATLLKPTMKSSAHNNTILVRVLQDSDRHNIALVRGISVLKNNNSSRRPNNPAKEKEEEQSSSSLYNTKRVLIIDDEPDITLTYKSALEAFYEGDSKKTRTKFEVYTYNDPLEALSNFKPNFYDMLLIDINLPNMNGFELYEKLLKMDVNMRVCFVSAGEVNEKAIREIHPSINIGCFIKKPVSMEDLVKRVKAELE